MNEKTSFPSDVADRFQVRMTPGLRDQIERRAKANGRSMNTEIVLILEAAIAGDAAEDERLSRIEAKLDRLLAKEDDR